jgi:L-lactate utilization protein LutC
LDDNLLDTFAREAGAVGAGVHVTSRSGLGATLARLLEGAGSAIVAAGLEAIVAELQNAGLRVVAEDSDGRAAGELPTAEVGICKALAGVAASGSVLVGPGSGLEGVISMLPPRCVLILDCDDLYADLAAALCAAAPLIATSGSRVAFVTGPSRTSDIELTPVIGVHGPLRLDVVIVDD